MKEKILFVDTETGGLDPNKYSLLSVGLVVWYDFEIIDSIEILIDDGKLIVSDAALKINRINLDHHHNVAQSSSNAIDEIKTFIATHFDSSEKITLAGHNVNFDIGFLKVFFSQNGDQFERYFSHRTIDTASILYFLFLAGKIKQKAISSNDAFKLFKVNASERHTALNDAMATAELFTKLISLLKRRLKMDMIDEKSSDQYILFENIRTA